jgi:hypothetical protein
MGKHAPRPMWQVPTLLGCLTGLAILAGGAWMTFG